MAIVARCNVGLAVLVACSLLFCTSVRSSDSNVIRFRSRSLTDAGSSSTVFDVKTFGAKADGKTDNFESFMKAWVATCKASAPSKLLIPPGEFVLGPVVFQGPCSNTPTVEVVGSITATADISEYSSDDWISFDYVDDLTITGNGTFHGQGAAVWKYNNCKKNSKCKLLPTSIKFHQVKNAFIHGISSIDAKSFHIGVGECQNITFDNINIIAPDESPNTDGIHISRSSNVNITNSNIGTGDDCVSIGQGSKQISISKVFCGPGHGISVGSLGKYEDEEDVTGIVVSNCTLSNTTNGARIKTWGDSPPSICSSITYQDIIMIAVKNPIIITQSYGKKNAGPSNVQITDVHFRNIQGTTVSEVPVSLECSSTHPCTNVELADINLTPDGNILKSTSNEGGDKSPLTATCENVKGKASGVQNPQGCF